MAAWALTLLLLCAPGLDEELERAVDTSRVKRSGLSLIVGEVGALTPRYALAADTPRIPASNQKILTAAAALSKLGKDFRFRTVIAKHGDDLYVVGDGDPNFSGRFFDGDPTTVLRRLAKDLKKQGVTSAKRLVLDVSRFDRVTVHPDWPADQLDKWYCAPVAALVYNDSCWDVTVGPGVKPGGPALITIAPSLVQPRLENQCLTGKGVINIMRHEGGILVRGATNHEFTGHLTVRQPARFFGRAFRSALRAEGIPTGEIAFGSLPKDAEPAVVYRSTLKRTLPVLLAESQNLYAECLFKRIGDGTFPGGGKAVLAALKAMGVATNGVEPTDGSGLARTNRLTARALFQCLSRYKDEPVFVEALASGGTGTLRRRYRALGPRIRAKTGTIRGVTALSGYVTGPRGERYVFVILANGPSVKNARGLQDRIVGILSR